jgi:hypothetical protein
MSVENVGNPLRIVLLLLYIREFTQEKGLMHVENVGNPLRKERILLSTGSSHWRKAL